VSFVKANFSEIDQLVIDTLPPTNKAYDIIFSNPPYFSASTVKGRVTEENEQVLVSGNSGLEAFESILASLTRSMTNQTAAAPIVDNNTLVVFQIPSGSHKKVIRSLAQYAEVIEVVFDESNISKCIVLKLKQHQQ